MKKWNVGISLGLLGSLLLIAPLAFAQGKQSTEKVGSAVEDCAVLIIVPEKPSAVDCAVLIQELPLLAIGAAECWAKYGGMEPFCKVDPSTCEKQKACCIAIDDKIASVKRVCHR
jgi:hypothetical protein